MKIGIDSRYLDSQRKTGVENYLTNLVNNLADSDRNNQYVLYFNSARRGKGQFPVPPHSNITARVIRLPNFKLRLFNRVYAELLNAALRKDHVDVAHFMASAFPVKPCCKCVTTVHDLTWYRFPDLQNNKEAGFLNMMMGRAISLSDTIIAVSETTRVDISDLFSVDKSRIHVIPLGTSFQKPAIEKHTLNLFKKLHNFGATNVLFVGSQEKRKNIEITLRALREIRLKHRLNFKLVLVGAQGSASDSLLRLIQSLDLADAVITFGYATEDEILLLYSAVDMFVFPSFYEGFGLPCIEAMKLEVPLVLSDISVFHEVAGDAALYFGTHDLETLVHCMLRLASDGQLRRSMIDRGVQRSKLYNWKSTAQKTLSVYHKLGAHSVIGH